MTNHKPAHLGVVDSLAVTTFLGKHVPSEDGEEARFIPNLATYTVPESVAKRFAKLWRNLPDGSKMKCYAPAFRLRFFAGQNVLVDASVCWHCNTIGILEENEVYYIGFDSTAPASQKLLHLLQEMFAEQPENE